MKLALAAAALLAACLARPASAGYAGLTAGGYTFGSDVSGECARSGEAAVQPCHQSHAAAQPPPRRGREITTMAP